MKDQLTIVFDAILSINLLPRQRVAVQHLLPASPVLDPLKNVCADKLNLSEAIRVESDACVLPTKQLLGDPFLDAQQAKVNPQAWSEFCQ